MSTKAELMFEGNETYLGKSFTLFNAYNWNDKHEFVIKRVNGHYIGNVEVPIGEYLLVEGNKKVAIIIVQNGTSHWIDLPSLRLDTNALAWVNGCMSKEIKRAFKKAATKLALKTEIPWRFKYAALLLLRSLHSCVKSWPEVQLEQREDEKLSKVKSRYYPTISVLISQIVSTAKEEKRDISTPLKFFMFVEDFCNR